MPAPILNLRPSPRTRPQAARIQAALATLIFAGAVAGLLGGVGWISSWFYDLSWWSYIAFVDALVHLRRGESLLLSRPRAFCLLAIFSAAFWLFFEAANFRLENWYYVGIPRDPWSRGPGVFLAFATVLPAVLETYELLAAFGLARTAHSPPWNLRPWVARALVFLGAAFLILPIAFPQTCYPLIWGALVLLAEPWLAARGERGLLATLRAGDPRPVLRLLAAGLVCGLLWEALNWHAHAKWIYTVPFLEDAKLFEMPLPGFLGFPPFALECFTFARVLVALGWMPEWELAASPTPAARRAYPRRELAAALLACLFAVPVILGINRWTLRATEPQLDEIAGVPPAVVAALQRAGIASARELIEAADAGRLHVLLDLAAPEAVDPQAWERWVETARLMHVHGLGARGVRWLATAEIDSVEALARADPDALIERFARAALPTLVGPAPGPAEVRVWVSGARRALAAH